MKSTTNAGPGRDRRSVLERDLDALRAEMAALGDDASSAERRAVLRERAAALETELERIELAIEIERQQDA